MSNLIFRDARHFQIFSQLTLLSCGILLLGFDLRPGIVAVAVGCALAFQLLFASVFRATLDPRSVLASSLSLCLLLRTTEARWAALAAFLVVASKFLIRVRGKHVFNPSGFALAALLILVPDRVWVSAGQWGSTAWIAFLLACLGSLVLYRARRSDITLAFLVSFAGLVAVRSIWLNDPMAITLHRLESGSLLLFGFFMISDPKATPDSRPGRILFAILVALGGYLVQFHLYRTNGLIYSLAFFSKLVPLIDWLLPGERFEWDRLALRQNPVALPAEPSAQGLLPQASHHSIVKEGVQ